MTSSIASHGETLAPLMHRAGFRYVFLGIENILEDDLQFLRAAAKNTARDNGKNSGNASGYYMLQRATTYQELGPDYFDKRNTVRATNRLVKRLEALGHRVILEPCFNANPSS
jgi:hypothetical protein